MSINPEEWFGKTKQDPSRVRTMWVDVKDPGLREVLGVPEGGMPLQDFLGFQAPVAQEPVKPPIEPGFTTSVKRSSYGVAEDFTNAAQLFAQVAQMPEAAEYLSRKAASFKAAQQEFPRAVPGIEDIHGLGDFGTWAIETMGEQVPILASFLIPGGIAGKAVGLAGKGQAAVKAAGLSAGFLSDLGLMTGESVGMAKEAGQPITDMRVVGSGFGKAALDFIPFWAAAKQVGIAGPIEKAILKHAVDAGYLKRALGNAAVIMATEIPTETMQEWINNELDNYFTGYDGPITEDQKSRLYNAAAGAALFGAFGVYAPKTPPPPGAKLGETEETQPKKPLGLPPPMSFEFKGVPIQADVNAPSGFDFRNLYDKKTGALRTTAADYLRIVKEQTQVKYDPLSDTIRQPPSSASYTTVVPGWQQEGQAWYLDAPAGNPEGAKAQVAYEVVPGPTGWVQGFGAYDAYGNSLGHYPDITSAQVAASQAIYAKGKTFVFDTDGMHIKGEVDGHTQFVQSIGQPVTPIEMAATAIEQSKPTKPPTTLAHDKGEAGVAAISNDQELMGLIDVRNEFVNDKDNYRTTDGEMKKAAVKRLAAIDARIARYAQLKGVPNLNTSEVADVTGVKIDEKLGEIANEEAKQAEELQYPNLNPFESKFFAALNEKSMYDELTDFEKREWDRLAVKAKTGEVRFGEYVEAAPEQLAEFSAEEKALLAKIRKGRARLSKATRAIARMRGVQASKGRRGFQWQNATSSEGEQAYTLSLNGEELGGIQLEEISDMGELENATREELALYGNNPKGWYVYKTEEGGAAGGAWSGPFKTQGEAKADLEKEFGFDALLQSTDGKVIPINKKEYIDPGAIPGEAMWVSADNSAAVIETEDGMYEAVKVVANGDVYSLGRFDTAIEAANVTRGASPKFVAEVQNALANLWRSFMIRPKLVILSTADILNNKVSMTQDARDTLLSSHGIFMTGEPGTVYIHVDQHKTVEETVGTLVHEMIGHFGLRALLPTQYWDSVMQAYAIYNKDRIRLLEAEGRSEFAMQLREAGETRLADIMTADEAVAYTAQARYSGDPLKPFEQRFLDRVIATVRRWFRDFAVKLLPESWQKNIFKVLPFNEKDVLLMLSDAASALRTSEQKYVNTTRAGRVHIMSAKGQELMKKSTDSYGSVWGVKAAGLFMQAIQFAERYNIPGVADYMKTVQLWAARKSSLQSMPVELLERWQLYNKKGSNRLAEALLFMTAESDQTGHALSTEREAEVLKQHGVDEDGAKIYEQIKQSFLKTLDYLENGLIRQEIRRHVKDAAATKTLYDAYMEDLKSGGRTSKFAALVQKDLGNFDLGSRLNKIKGDIEVLRDRNYFPYMRFGRYAIWVRAKDDVYIEGKKFFGPRGDKRGQMILFETFESFREQQEALKDVEAMYGKNASVGSGYVSDQEYTMLGMPPALYDTLRTQLDLNEKQLENLKEIYFTKSPGQRFLRSMVHRRGIKGFSTDAIRVYSSYMLNAASHIARIEYGQDLDSGITAIRNYAQDAGAGGGPGVTVGHVRSYWEDHYKYIMNPENDWAGLRAVGFMWYLGFNVKSAMVNMTQVPLVALPYLGARFGDGKASAALTKAYKDAFKIMRGQALPTGDLEAAIKQGIAEGFLDESLATILAGFSESSVLQRMLPETDAQRRLNQVAWAGSWMFRNVEKLNRYVTFLAARQLALDSNGGNTELAFAEAKEAVQSSMFEYAKWNRAPFMRGKKSVFFLFWSYMQGLAYLMAGGKGKKTAMRVWMMMLLAAGLQGIPFAENILDLIDWSSKEVKEALGYDDPYTDTRLELRKLAQTITDNPDMLLHGWSRHYGLGPLHLLSLAGVPVPEVDTSGSMSAGRWLPGTDKLTSTERDPDKKFGQTLVDVLGPVAGTGYGLFSAIIDDNPDSWKKWERAMPSALKGISQGIRRGERSGEEFRGGGKLAEFDPNNDTDRVALWMNMLAFQPTKVGQAYEVIGSKENLRRYWTGRQAMVMENWAYAMRSGDPENMADARAAMHEFNEQVPDPMLRMNPEKIRRSMKARAKRIKQREMGLPNEKGYRRLYEEIDQIYGLR